MRILFSCFTLIFLLAAFGCAANQSYFYDNPSYYYGVKMQGVEEAKNYNSNGITLASQDMYEEAIQEFKKAAAIDYFFSEAYLNLSKSYFAINNLDFALYYNTMYYETSQFKEYTYYYRLDD